MALEIPDLNAWRWRAGHLLIDVMPPETLDYESRYIAFTIPRFFNNLYGTKVIAEHFEGLKEGLKFQNISLLEYMGDCIEFSDRYTQKANAVTINNPELLLKTIKEVPFSELKAISWRFLDRLLSVNCP